MNILIGVYNDIERDARVIRQIYAIKDTLTVDVLCCGKMDIEGVNFIQIVPDKKLNEISFFEYVKRYIHVAKNKKYDIIYGNDYYSCLPLLLLKKDSRRKMIYDAHELMIDSKALRERFFMATEKRIMKKADLIICASEQRSQIMKDYYHLNNAPTVIRNISKLSVNDVQFTDAENRFFEGKRIKVIYAGVLKRGRRLELLCMAAKKMCDKYDFMIVGDGEQREELIIQKEKYNISNLIFTGGKKSWELGAYISKCDIGYLYYPCTNLNNKYCAPNKVYEYSGLGLPIVSNNNPTIEDYFKDYSFGETFSEETDDNVTLEGLCRAIDAIAQNLSTYRNNAKMYSETFNWDSESKLLLDSIMSRK